MVKKIQFQRKELEVIESLGKLYPEFAEGIFKYKNYQGNNYSRAWWIDFFCRYYLERRMPQLEKFIKENNNVAWADYKDYFDIKDEQCGKKS